MGDTLADPAEAAVAAADPVLKAVVEAAAAAAQAVVVEAVKRAETAWAAPDQAVTSRTRSAGSRRSHRSRACAGMAWDAPA